jgi:hypothetical protein
MRRPKALPAIAVALVALGLSASTAGAETVHVFSQTISGNELAGTALNNPKGVAVDGSSGPNAGSVYVADSNNNRISKFNAAGQFQLMWGINVNEGSGDPNVCTNAGAPTDICKPASSAQVPGSAVGAFGPTQPIEVDSTSGPSAGDIYLLGFTGTATTIQKFDPSGHLVTAFGPGTPFPGAVAVPGGPRSMAIDTSGNLYTFSEGDIVRKWDENGALLATSSQSPRASYFQFGLAVDGDGNYFQLNEEPNGGRSIQWFTPGGTDLGQITKSGAGFVSNEGIVYDQTTDELFSSFAAFPGGSYVRAYSFNGSGEIIQPGSAPCAPQPTQGCEPTEAFGSEQISAGSQSPGIAVSTSDHKLYIADRNANDVKVFSRIDLPKITNLATSEMTRTSVKFSSHVDPDGGGEVINCKFEYGLTKEYSASAPCAPGSFSSPTDASATLPTSTLTAGTTYHYRLVAGNANGDRPTSDSTFTTLPAVGGVTTGAATEVKQLTTVLGGSFTGDGVDTKYFFEYGTTTKYGQKTPLVDQGTASGPQAITATATQLIAYTPYHYRFVTQNSYGTTYGTDQEFHTIEPDLPQTESTFTSFVDKDSAVVNAEVDPGFGLTLYRFEYGTDTSYGSRALVGGPIDPESSDLTATSELEDLSAGTTYHYRVRLTNFSGSTVGPDQTFTTPSLPGIASTSASGIGETTATLSAGINPSLSPTNFQFEYGTSTAYGATTPAGSLGADGVVHAVTAALSGLAPGTTYHYRVVAANGVGGATGTDQTFTTLAPPQVTPQGPKPKCKKGFVRKNGKCRKKPKHKKQDKRG